MVRYPTLLKRCIFIVCTVVLACALVGCGGSGGSSSDSSPAAGGAGGTAGAEDVTSGEAFSLPTSVPDASFNSSSAVGANGALIDVSQSSQGYFSASAINDSRLKVLVKKDNYENNYDLPGDGTPIIVPVNYGNGTYEVAVMQNTSGHSYVELFSTTVDVSLESEFAPFLRPNVFCSFTPNSALVQKAQELVASAQNQGDALASIYQYISDNVTYDKEKAERLSTETGYVPNPDDTLRQGTGICFDYASLAGAMLRSVGIPCKIITGYVSPNDIYHAWNMVYINGSWQGVEIKVDPNTWTRIDTTFASSGRLSTVGDGTNYTDRYVY